MRRLFAWLKGVSRAETGQTLVEYALIVALVSIAAIIVIVLIGDRLDSVFK